MSYCSDGFKNDAPRAGTPEELARTDSIARMSAKEIKAYIKEFRGRLEKDLIGIDGIVSDQPEKWGMGAIIQISKDCYHSVEKALTEKGYKFHNVGIGFSYFGNYHSRFLYREVGNEIQFD